MRALPIALAALAAAPAAAAGDLPAYHGFRFEIAEGGDRVALLAAAARQVDIVEGVGLTAATLDVLRGYTVHLAAGPGGGRFGRDGVFVNLPPRADDRPILLHELLHAYQARLLAGGTANPTLRRFFAEAHRPGLWPAGSYMLSNVAEYFAMTASVELYGHAARPPFTRAALEATQPVYAAWIKAAVR